MALSSSPHSKRRRRNQSEDSVNSGEIIVCAHGAGAPPSSDWLPCVPRSGLDLAYAEVREHQRSYMDREHPRNKSKTTGTSSSNSQDVSSNEWEFINMTGEEEDLINRMYRLVGDRWDLIAGRVPGRRAEEIERFWMMKHCKVFAEKRK